MRTGRAVTRAASGHGPRNIAETPAYRVRGAPPEPGPDHLPQATAHLAGRPRLAAVAGGAADRDHPPPRPSACSAWQPPVTPGSGSGVWPTVARRSGPTWGRLAVPARSGAGEVHAAGLVSSAVAPRWAVSDKTVSSSV
ncbi:hypothetical protein Apa02nite_033380 [Actinoplanes palleronii]|uniref:Uncharacterized protein n=1 Tax=Actinoplanes palleronii TaxID=113570 RepID=A0ABQ4B9G1_9ACTN|nr:hypothetical protein Apa02nite_033380 [Actinoplanes palleronii]